MTGYTTVRGADGHGLAGMRRKREALTGPELEGGVIHLYSHSRLRRITA